MPPVRLINSSVPRRKILGLHGSAPAWFIADVLRNTPRAIIVCPDKRLVDEVTEDLHFFRGGTPPAVFSPWETLPLEPVSPGVEISAQRIQALHAMRTKASFLVVTSADALVQKVIAPDSFETMLITLKHGGILHRDRFIHTLIDGGFQNSKSVIRIGEVSSKGSVIDFFPSTSSRPIRVQYDHDRIVRLQTFDPESQRSLEEISSVEILPVREFSLPLWYSQARNEVIQAFKNRATETQTPSREVEKVLHAIDERADYPGLELLQYIAAPSLPSFFDLIPEQTTVFVVDKYQTLRAMEDFIERAHERGERLREEQHLIPRATDVYLDFDLVSSKLQGTIDYELATVAEVDAEAVTENVRSESILELATRMKTSIGSGSAFEPLKEFLEQWRRRSYSIAFSVGSHTRAQRLQSILLGIGTDAPILTTSASEWIALPRRPGVAIILGHLHTGFRLPNEKLIFVSENDVFGERSYRSGNAPRISAKKLLSSLSLLKEGDFVVHIDYGIGLYHGLKHITVEGILGDFLHIEYSDSTLYLPAHQIGRIQKFVATEGQKPHIDKLSSTRWARTKQKIRDSIVTLAGDLIRLYASRSVAKGWRYEPQGAEDERFADTFPFDETPDQRIAIEETLKDLAADKPMDRLVCGDVGFGKTEVAIRAAFKATQHARQVAVLVPTTILVEQHKKNFIERFAGYPVKVGAISRFYPAVENQKTLDGVASGEIDIVIGTHRLLQHDVHFHDLGLLIIDEEHRFGVKQKERLRSYRTNVDVLTLTATPIPRTLHMSLLDIRDISLIHTAPVDRKVVHTYVAERDDALVRDAIQRELRRGGQVFYIHNRVQNIALVTQRLAEMLPEARFEFAHGQMTESSLERIMRRFTDREIDVLVVTTIVESGLDVPNANTIIIDRADQFGLAQLYQLRGRVGRSKRQAFAYLLVPHMRTLSGEAHERLKVLQSLDALGVGFNLAIRDLEIRGAGNLLGKEQSGNVLSVGFDMYCRILQEAVADLKGDEPTLEDIIDPDVRVVGVEAFIPENYVPDIGERLVLYQRLSNIRSDEEAFDIQREMEDRFGPGGEEVENLFLLMRYRGLLRRHGVVKAEVTPTKASLTFSHIALLRDGHKPTANTRVDGLKALHLVEQMPHRYRFGRGHTFSLLFEDPQKITFVEVYRRTADVLNRIQH